MPAGQRGGGPRLLPDPWWKARHKKRRVFTPGFAADAARILHERRTAVHRHRCGGILRRDDRNHPGDAGVPRGAFRNERGVPEAVGFQTNFERKARQKGTPIWRAEFERTIGPVTEAADPSC